MMTDLRVSGPKARYERSDRPSRSGASLPRSGLLKGVAISAALATAPVAYGGTIMESVTRDLNGAERTLTVTTAAQDGRMRVESAPGGAVMIFRDQAIYHLNPREKTYLVMDSASMKRMAEQLNPMLKQMQEQLAQMPPEQRAQVEKMMGDSLPGAAQRPAQEFRQTDRSGAVDGRGCKYLEIYEGGALAAEVCVAPAEAVEGSQELLSAARNLQSLMRELLSHLDAPWLRNLVERQAANFDELGGIPVLTRQYADGKPMHETTLNHIRKQALPASFFDVPAGFTRRQTLQH